MSVPRTPRFIGASAAMLIIMEFITITACSAKQISDPIPKYVVCLLFVNAIAASFAFIGAIKLNKCMLLPFFFTMTVLILIHVIFFVVQIPFGMDDWMDVIHVWIIAFNFLMVFGVGVLYCYMVDAIVELE